MSVLCSCEKKKNEIKSNQIEPNRLINPSVCLVCVQSDFAKRKPMDIQNGLVWVCGWNTASKV